VAFKSAKESEIQKLVRVYRNTVKRLARDFVAGVDISRPRAMGLLQDAFFQLEKVDQFAEKWAKRNIQKLYGAVVKQTREDLERLGLRKRDVDLVRKFSRVNERMVHSLIADPEIGFAPSLHDATAQIRKKIRLIRNQAKALRAQQAAIDEVIAKVGILEGRNLVEIRNALVEELTSGKNASSLIWKPKLSRLGPRHIFANLANLPYVEFPSGRTMRLDRYAELVARTKSRQAATLAQRYTLLESGRDLVLFSNNRSLVNDACNLYIGRAFALTEEASKLWGVARVEELPNGGTPLHPNCRHFEQPFFPEKTHWRVQDRALTKPPGWSLNKPYPEVQKTFMAKGGDSFAEKHNPNFHLAKVLRQRKSRTRFRA
jgi:hypothetical protein